MNAAEPISGDLCREFMDTLKSHGLQQGAMLFFVAQRVIAEKIGLEVKAVIPVIEIPQTTSGKMQRYKLRQ